MFSVSATYIADLEAEILPPLRSAAVALAPKAAAPGALRVVLVLEGDFQLTMAVLFCLHREPHLRVHVLSRERHSPLRFSRYVRAHHYFPADQPDVDFIAFAGEVIAKTYADVLLPVDVEGMRFVLAHRPALTRLVELLPLPEAEAYETATDKARLAAFMQAHGIPAPATIIDVRHNLAAQLAGFSFPVLLKPVAEAGGRGIARYETAAEVLAAVAKLPATGSYLIQNCLEGYDIDCNVLYQHGRLVAYSIQKGLVPAASTYAPTEAIEFVRNSAVLAVADQLMSALRWNGVAHIDLRYDARTDQMRVIEVNTRFWLTVVGSVVTAQVNFPVLACHAALGPLKLATSRLGRYIPLARLLAYRWRQRGRAGESFLPHEIAVWPLLSDLLPRLYRLLRGRAASR